MAPLRERLQTSGAVVHLVDLRGIALAHVVPLAHLHTLWDRLQSLEHWVAIGRAGHRAVVQDGLEVVAGQLVDRVASLLVLV